MITGSADIGERVVLNKKASEEIANAMVENMILTRQKFFDMFMDRKRSVEEECGYPKLQELNAVKYKDIFDRDPVCNRVVSLFPAECWQVCPEVYETEDLEPTPFELGLEQIGRELFEIGNYEGQEGNPIWEYLERADILSGIGRYGVILLGFDDGGALSEPLKLQKIEVKPSEKTEEVERPDGTKFQKKTLNYSLAPAEGNKPADAEVPKPGVDAEQPKPAEPTRKLLYIRVLDETMAPITQWDNDPKSVRFGKPLEYTITVSGPDTGGGDGRGVVLTDSQTTHKVHWSRVLHIADNLQTSEVLGTPRLQVPYNRLYDLHKLLGGSAEMYWRGAFPGLAFETHPQLGPQVKMDVPAMRAQIGNYTQGLDRYLAVPGVQVKSLAPQVVDPSKQIEAMIDAVCIYLACPKRVFLGSERGELASSQDARAWYGVRIPRRQNRYITPRIVVPFIIRLIQVGALIMPEQFSAAWPDVMSVTALEQADVTVKRTDAMAKYIQGDVNAIMTPKDYLVRELKYSEEEADEIIKNKLEEEEDEDFLDVHAREDEMAEEEAARAAEQFGQDADFRQQEIDQKEKLAKMKPAGKPFGG